MVATARRLDAVPRLDFSGAPVCARFDVEGMRLAYGHHARGAFVTETSLIEPLYHEHIRYRRGMLTERACPCCWQTPPAPARRSRSARISVRCWRGDVSAGYGRGAQIRESWPSLNPYGR